MRSKHRMRRIILCVASALLITFAFYIWYNFYDIIGLEKYTDAPIAEVCFSDRRVFLLTKEGKGYVSGNYRFSKENRKYSNVVSYKHKGLQIPVPICFYEGKIKQILTRSSSEWAFFITDKDELYVLKEGIEIQKITDHAADACFDYNDGYYVITTAGALLHVTPEAENMLISSNVKQVRSTIGRTYVLLTDGQLCELTKEGESFSVSEPLFFNVLDFETKDRSDPAYFRYDPAPNFEIIVSEPLINILTTDGALYAKGEYDLAAAGVSGAVLAAGGEMATMLFDNWTIVGEGVTSFSMSKTGTVMLHTDGTCSYFGFDTIQALDTEFGHRIIPVDGARKVICEKSSVCIDDGKGTFFLWGDWTCNPFFYHGGEPARLFSEQPLRISYSYEP